MTTTPMPQLNAVSKSSVEKRGKENFPVASLLLPADTRKEVIAFYHFARHADDIADDTTLAKEVRLQKLLEVSKLLAEGQEKDLPAWAKEYYRQTKEGKVSLRCGLDLLSAFIQDVTKERYGNWEDLIDYCMRSAAPVGRAVLQLHGEKEADSKASDTLCSVLQILNHLQDMKEDYLERNRVYFPEDWFVTVKDLGRRKAHRTVKQAMARALDKVDAMLEESVVLIPTIKRSRLRIEIAFIYEIACALAAKLRQYDPLKYKVKLRKDEQVRCLLKGIWRALRAGDATQEYAKEIARKSHSSFLLPMMTLRREKRQAMLALYAFCRVVDDAVDEAPSLKQAEQNLAFWQKELAAMYKGVPAEYITKALWPHVQRFGLPQSLFQDMIQSLRMDARGQMVRPTAEELQQYCYGVASSVGLLSIEIFGYTHESAKQFAYHLGQAMQHINIMRDVKEDAAAGRVYLPKEALATCSLDKVPAKELLALIQSGDAVLEGALEWMEAQARFHLKEAEKHLHPQDKQAMKPALLMRHVYYAYLQKMKACNWHPSEEKPLLAWYEKLYLLRFFLLPRRYALSEAL